LAQKAFGIITKQKKRSKKKGVDGGGEVTEWCKKNPGYSWKGGRRGLRTEGFFSGLKQRCNTKKKKRNCMEGKRSAKAGGTSSIRASNKLLWCKKVSKG